MALQPSVPLTDRDMAAGGLAPHRHDLCVATPRRACETRRRKNDSNSTCPLSAFVAFHAQCLGPSRRATSAPAQHYKVSPAAWPCNTLRASVRTRYSSAVRRITPVSVAPSIWSTLSHVLFGEQSHRPNVASCEALELDVYNASTLIGGIKTSTNVRHVALSPG